MFDILIVDTLGKKHNFRDADKIFTTNSAGTVTNLDPSSFSLADVQDSLVLNIVDKSDISIPKSDISSVHITIEKF